MRPRAGLWEWMKDSWMMREKAKMIEAAAGMMKPRMTCGWYDISVY